jgi:hypothetical protein
MARDLPQNYLDTLAATALERQPQCKVEIEYGGAYHDVSADVTAVTIQQTMEMRAEEAQVSLADPGRVYSRLWSAEADPRADCGHRIRIWLTNSPADYIQVFQGWIVSGAREIKRGEAEIAQLSCMDNGRTAWLSEITMEPVIGRSAGDGKVIRVRRNQAQRQIPVIIANILKQPAIGFTDADILLGAMPDPRTPGYSYMLVNWKPGTFNPMSDIAQLLGVRHMFGRFRWDGKFISQGIIPGAVSWTYGALHSNPLVTSFAERWQEPERMASVVHVAGYDYDALPGYLPTASQLNFAAGGPAQWEWYWGSPSPLPYGVEGQYQWGPWGHGHCEDNFIITAPTMDRCAPDSWEIHVSDGTHSAVYTKTGVASGSVPAVNCCVYAGQRDDPFANEAIIRMYWNDPYGAGTHVTVQVWASAPISEGYSVKGSATNTELDAAGYKGFVDEPNDYVVHNDDADWLAARLATWLHNECYPATLVVPCNLVHEPGDLVAVALDRSDQTLGTVNYIVVSHRIEYERGKPNLSTLELVRDTTHMY